MKNTEDILGFPVTTKNREECVKTFYSWIKSDKKCKYFVGLNPHSFVLSEKDKIFKQSLINADLILPDGIGIIIASYILKGSITERVTGSGIFRELSKLLNNSGKFRYFFLGGCTHKLDKIKNKLSEEYPNISVAGVYAPPYRQIFSTLENQEMIDLINTAKPDVLWVGLSAPKQEKWILFNKSKINVKLICPIGAVFDYYSGTVKRPEKWFLKNGLEWLIRLLQEPKRLWRRTFLSAPIFILRIIKEKYRHLLSK